MGGIIAVTIRYSNGEELRESCWTNILPKGLFNWKFWVEEESEEHTRKFMGEVLENRKKDRDIDSLWGRWHKLAPVEYGQIIVDYQKKAVVHSQGYCGMESDHVVAYDHESMEKFLELYARGLVTECHDIDDRRKNIKTKVPVLVDKVKETYHWVKEHDHVSGVVSLMDEKLELHLAPSHRIGADPRKPEPEPDPPKKFGMIMYGVKNWIPVRGGDRDQMKDVYAYARKNFKLTKAEEQVWKRWFKEEKE
jgi:hypothetical protein